MQKAPCHRMSLAQIQLQMIVGHKFQGLFKTSVTYFTFPSQYSFTIGIISIFRLGRWSSHIQSGFHVSQLTH